MDSETDRAAVARRGSPYLNTRQAAHYLKLSVRTLERMRARGLGPTPRRHALMVLYHIDDLAAWSHFKADSRRDGDTK